MLQKTIQDQIPLDIFSHGISNINYYQEKQRQKRASSKYIPLKTVRLCTTEYPQSNTAEHLIFLFFFFPHSILPNKSKQRQSMNTVTKISEVRAEKHHPEQFCMLAQSKLRIILNQWNECFPNSHLAMFMKMLILVNALSRQIHHCKI